LKSQIRKSKQTQSKEKKEREREIEKVKQSAKMKHILLYTVVKLLVVRDNIVQ
jgi:hypothetical protein